MCRVVGAPLWPLGLSWTPNVGITQKAKKTTTRRMNATMGGVLVASVQHGRIVSTYIWPAELVGRRSPAFTSLQELVGRRSPAFTSLHAAPSKEQRHRGAIRVIHGPGCGDRHRGAITSPSHIADEHAASWAGICCLSRLRGSPLSCALRATKTLLMLHTGRLCRS